jgi:predicted nucleic acid-binding protein
MIIRYVLDACALIALLKDEKGAEAVSAIFNSAFKGEAHISMNKINLLEVYYDVYRATDKETAYNVVLEFIKRPVTVVHEISDAVFAEAGRLKATYKISLADSIALAEASVSDGLLVTADHHELESVEKFENIHFHWIR